MVEVTLQISGRMRFLDARTWIRTCATAAEDVLEDLVRLLRSSGRTNKDFLATAAKDCNRFGRIDAPRTDPWTNTLSQVPSDGF